MIRSITTFAAILLTLNCFGHPADTCLARISQLSEELKECQLQQVEATQCDWPDSQLQQQIHRCGEKQFTAQDILNAKHHGFNLVDGDLSQSPFQKKRQQQQWENSLMKPNVEKFQRAWPQHSGMRDALMEHFHTATCPRMYEGAADRWLYIKATTLYRYSLDLDDAPPPEAYTVHLMSREAQGTCYLPNENKGKKLSYEMVNLPERFLLELEKVPDIRLVRCDDSLCAAGEQQLAKLYDRYQAAHQEYLHLAECSDILDRNRNTRMIKGKARSTVRLPDHCSGDELPAQLVSLKAELQTLDHRLFQDVTIRIEMAKTE